MNVPLHLPALRRTGLADRTTSGRDAGRWRLAVGACMPRRWRWFDLWLKDRDTGILDGPPIRYWMPGADEWRTATAWPPPGARHRELALRADGGLSDDEGTLGQRSYRCLGTGLNRRSGRSSRRAAVAVDGTSGPLGISYVDMVLSSSDDQSKGAPAIMEFRHAPVGTSTTNTISSASRLLFPVLDESDGGLDA